MPWYVIIQMGLVWLDGTFSVAPETKRARGKTMQLPIRVENRETIEGFGLMAQASLPPIISQIIDFALFTTASRIDSAVLFFHAECFPKPERKSYITLEIT